ncbi:hypothetical protein [uncultured Chitinophaga sp.]|jgi:hypothetical protein|uniref:hypothetical protein n=1 Tax=uncultured Chitinophaga sp. TaxID=339340 RepID=UPI0026217835|nr:hypothetical protein [uncultured Chitinophaga sp.]
MYDNFLTDEKEYAALEQYWKDHFTALLKAAGEKPEDWQYPYYNTTFSNGTKFMDGNPIFSAQHLKTKETMKIVQEAFEGEELLEHWEDEEDQRLTIVCALTETSMPGVTDLLKGWIVKAGAAGK